MIGQEILHYRVLAKLGEGGMGEVFLAEDTKLDRKVALKFLPHHFSKGPEFKARFEHEAKAAAALNHPAIVTVYELNEHEGQLFIAMEYVDGNGLDELIKDGKLGLRDAIRITAQISEGLGRAHTAGIVHRDIKPSNILIDADGRARIVDFGLSTSHKATTKTPSGTTMGTLMYEAPEQMSEQPPDKRSDLYAVGVVLYEMIAGRPPFTGEYEAAIRAAILNDKPEPLARFKANVPDDVQRIVSKLLEKDPKLRHQTAEDLLADLSRLETQASKQRPLIGTWAAVGAAALMVAVLVVAYFTWPSRDAPSDGSGIMLAVLPFENLGDPADEYFADGITEEITSKLSVVDGLGVISRTSAMQYKATDKGLPEIAKELGVGYVLEGTVRWDKSTDPGQVRVTPQLIRVSDNTHLWAENYERPIAGIFAIQKDIATHIVDALDITLVEPKRRLLEAALTQSPEAYDFYLRGVQYSWVTMEEEESLAAIDMFERAIARDPGFAAAYGGLAGAHLVMYWYGHDRTEGRLRLAKAAIDSARALDPDLPVAQIALAGYYYWGLRDYDRALQEAEALKRRLPSSEMAYTVTGAIKRRQGRWEEAITDLARRSELNPASGITYMESGLTELLLRRYDRAEKLLDLAISLTPELSLAYDFLILRQTLAGGDLQKARTAVEGARGKIAEASLKHSLVTCDLVDRQYTEALGRLDSMAIPAFGDSATYYTTKAEVLDLLGDSSRADSYYDSARVFLEARQISTALKYQRDVRLARAYAGLGRREDALRLVRSSVSQCPLDADALDGSEMLRNQVEINLMLGNHEIAIDQLEYMLSIPSFISVPLLRLDPRWDPLRENPRFQELLERGHTVF